VNRKERRQQRSRGRQAAGTVSAPPRPGVSAALLAHANQPASIQPDFARLEREVAERNRRSGAVMQAFTEIKRQDKFEHEVEMRRRALAKQPDSAKLRHLLADALRARGDRAEAIELYRSCLDVPDAAETARFCLASLGALPPPEKMPSQMVAALYDRSAASFDNTLVHGLKYQGPGIIAQSIARVLGPEARDLEILDAGCGTGLCGAVLRPLARRLDGIDISSAMLQQAGAKGYYHRLKHGEICAALADRSTTYDLVVAGDMVIYLGDLGPLFSAIAGVLRPQGHFIFTTERAASGAYELHAAARYRHSDAYIAATAADADFDVVLRDDCVIRFEQGEPVAGSVFALRRR
jgi:predicted TPR repeat methyltransferase